jgi:hypothetical protein
MEKLKFGDKMMVVEEVRNDPPILNPKNKEREENLHPKERLLYICEASVKGIMRHLLYHPKRNQVYLPDNKVFGECYKKII